MQVFILFYFFTHSSQKRSLNSRGLRTSAQLELFFLSSTFRTVYCLLYSKKRTRFGENKLSLIKKNVLCVFNELTLFPPENKQKRSKRHFTLIITLFLPHTRTHLKGQCHEKSMAFYHVKCFLRPENEQGPQTCRILEAMIQIFFNWQHHNI